MARKAEPTFVTEQKPFPKVLRRLMNETNTSQPKLAAYVGVTRQAISLYATGQSTPDIYTFEKIADFFDVSYDYLLGKTENKQRENIDIGEKLGLSDETIETLQSFKKFQMQTMFDLINLFISSAKIRFENGHSLIKNALLYNLSLYVFECPNSDKGKILTRNGEIINSECFEGIEFGEIDEFGKSTTLLNFDKTLGNRLIENAMLLEIQEGIKNLREV